MEENSRTRNRLRQVLPALVIVGIFFTLLLVGSLMFPSLPLLELAAYSSFIMMVGYAVGRFEIYRGEA